VIRRVSETIKSGTKLFNRHNEDNSTTGRKSVGEVITAYTKEIGGKLRTVAIACMEAADAIIYDVCSIEADIYLDNGIVGDVDRITAIAVSNSKVDTPAFKNSKRMQIVQCFDAQEGPEHNRGKEKSMPITIEDLMTAPIDLLKQSVSARQIYPNQLFDLKSFEADREIGPILQERTSLQEKVNNLTAELATATTSIKEVSRKAEQATAKEQLKARMPKGLTDKQKTFIEKRFDPEKFDTINDEAIDKFIEAGKTEFQELAKLLGTDEGSSTQPPAGGGSNEDLGASEKSLDEAFAED
jgi:hypothetical protein